MYCYRSNTAISVICDRFIFAIGGIVNKDYITNIVECYDINKNIWQTLKPLNGGRSAATACSIENKYIFLFPGMQSKNPHTIEFLDVSLLQKSLDV